MKKTFEHIKFLPMLLLAAVAGGCSQDEAVWDEAAGNDVRFDGATVLMTTGRTATRAIDEDDEINGDYAGLEASDTTVYLTTDKKFNWGTFKMYMIVNGVGSGITDYVIKTGTYGQLGEKIDGTSLKWTNSTSKHTFYAWTLPETNSNTTKDESSCDPRDPKHPENYQKARNPNAIQMDAGDTTGIVNFGPRADINNNILEYFVGTKVGPVTHKDNGLSVNMIFRHLVTKVYITALRHIRSDGTAETLNSDDFLSIYFPEMPQQGIFNSGVRSGVFPYVKAKEDSKRGVESRYYHLFYLPPFKFSEWGRFEVAVEEAVTNDKNEKRYETRTYYGNLDEIVAGTGLTELKAGEAMSLELMLADGKVTGMSVYISNWNDAWEGTVSQPAKKGVYTFDDFDTMRSNGFDYVTEEYTDGNGNIIRVIKIFNNINVPDNRIESTIEVPAGWILDGMGHNITKNKGSKIKFSGTGIVRNLYVNGELTELNT